VLKLPTPCRLAKSNQGILYKVHSPLLLFPMGYTRSAAMKRPTVKPMAIWIIEAATLKTMALRLSVVVCVELASNHTSH
jgi:hypothetical protein